MKCRIIFKDILEFLGLDYKDASLITFYIFCQGISIPKNQINLIIKVHKNLLLKKLKINVFKMDIWTFW